MREILIGLLAAILLVTPAIFFVVRRYSLAHPQ